MMIRHWA